MAQQVATYIGGDQAILMYKPETTFITEYDGTTAAAVATAPTSPVLFGYANVPEITDEENTKSGYGIGNFDPLYFLPGRREYGINADIRIADPTFLINAIRTGTSGYAGLPQFALWTGASNYLGNGYTELYRYCAINQCTFNLQEGGGQELMANAQIWALCKDSSVVTAQNPSVSALKAPGTALAWHNLFNFSIGSDDYRDVIQQVQITLNNNLERKGCRPDGTPSQSSDLARCAYRFLPHTREVTVNLTLHNKLPASLRGNFAAGAIVAHATNGTNTMTITIPANAFKRHVQKGIEPGAQMSFTADFVSSGMTIATT